MAADWLLILVSGVLGSSHCIGMCGGFVVTIGASSPTLRDNVRRQLTYSLGRLTTYGFFGALAGFAGLRLSHLVPVMLPIQAALAMFAGLLLLVQGAMAMGWIAFGKRGAASGTCQYLTGSLFAGLLHGPGWRAAFVAGLFTGFLPCGLVYAFVALAVSSANVVTGVLIMLVFGLGTVPVMTLAGCGSAFLRPTQRRRMLQVAAGCVILTGCLSVGRGVTLLVHVTDNAAPVCPWCVDT